MHCHRANILGTPTSRARNFINLVNSVFLLRWEYFVYTWTPCCLRQLGVECSWLTVDDDDDGGGLGGQQGGQLEQEEQEHGGGQREWSVVVSSNSF